jgi:predicted polyphosphate/ATP-dependent NAD kinase
VKRRPELGLVVNPLAGLGGPLALKGSDGPHLPLPVAPGTLSHAERRAGVALRELSLGCPEVEVVTYPGRMGELATDAAGLSARIVGRLPSGGTSGRDTRWAIRELIGVGVDLILFAGGDGTAVDVLQAASDSLVALGVPAGVKMHSGVFGITPSHAGAAGAAFLNSDRRRTSDAEIVDLDEEAARAGVVLPRLRGVLRTPADRARIQATKTRSSIADVDALDAAAHMIATRMAPGRMYILGPGTSTRAVSQALGLAHTLLGVDVVRDRRLVALDVDAVQLDKLLEQHVPTLVLSPLGGQGFLIGRGNQQISANCLRRVGLRGILVIATEAKLADLGGRPLLVDSGDAALDELLRGYARVVTGASSFGVYPVGGWISR